MFSPNSTTRFLIYATSDRAVVNTGAACWDSIDITAGGFVNKELVCHAEPDGTISGAGAHYVTIGNTTVLVSLPVSSLFQIPAPLPNGVVDLSNRRAYYITGTSSSQIWEYNLDSGEQRIRWSTFVTSNGLLLATPGSVMVYANWIVPLP